MSSVFISHNWADKPLARKLARILRAAGIQVWLDEAEIKIGDSLIQKIRDGIDSVEYVVALLSPKSVSSEWVKKELDIAMTQEIEGKNIKVLPILAAPCDLPGFLKGKLYANMSSERAFKRALPDLMARLNAQVPPAALDGKKTLERTEQLLDGLRTSDVGERYKTLQSISYRDRNLLVGGVLEALLTLTSPDQPMFVRLEAIDKFRMIGDANYGSLIERHIEDSDTTIATATIGVLAQLKTKSAAPMLLASLATTRHPGLRDAILKYFANVALEDEAQALALSSTLKKLRAEAGEDNASVQLQALSVLGAQWEGSDDWALDEFLPIWERGNARIRVKALQIFLEAGEFFIGRSRLEALFVELLLRSVHSPLSEEEQTLAWIVALFYGRSADVWPGLRAASEEAIRDWTQHMDEYRLDNVLDKEDKRELIELCKTHSGETRNRLLDMVAEISEPNALKLLSNERYVPAAWRLRSVALSLARVNAWCPEYDGLLDSVESTLDKDVDHVTLLAIHVARWRAGRANLSGVLKNLPKEIESQEYQRSEIFQIKSALQYSRKTLNPSDRRLVQRLIARMNLE